MILLVDDRSENILPLKKILDLHHFTVDTASSGEEALKKVLKTDYAVIILDVQMPDMDGFEVANAIAGFGRAKHTSIMFLSAVNTDKKFITQGYTSGGVDYLTKPVDPDILVLKVKMLHKLYEQQQVLRATQASLQQEIEVRKQAEQALTMRMQELQTVLATLPQLAFTAGPDGRLEYVNQHWLRFARSPVTLPDTHPDDDMAAIWREALQSPDAGYSREVLLHDRDTDAYICHLLHVMPVRQQGQLIRWIGTFTNIQDQKQTAELLEKEVALRTSELQRKNNELERSNQEMQQFTWVVSHDLKEPLRKIQLMSDLVKQKYLADNPEATTYLDRSIQSSARLSTMINDLLAYSQLSVPETFQPTNLNDLLTILRLDYEVIIRQKEAVVTIDPMPEIEAMPTRIRQVFQNLLSNALKFVRPGVPPRIAIRAERINACAIDAPLDPNGDFYRFTVSDNGIGFDEKFSNRIFVIFQRLNNRDSYEGTGIGLAIAHKNVSAHHGLFSVRSQVNEGSCFTFVLPITQRVIE